MENMGSLQATECPFCRGRAFSSVFVYDEPPPGEVRFEFARLTPYHREVFRCQCCGHFLSLHGMETTALYEEQYVSSTYGKDGLRGAFDRIVALDPSRSDNVGRVRHILEFARGYLTGPGREGRPPAVLDVGSGLCVFLHRMKEAGWRCVALDPDERAARHARETVDVEAVCGEFLSAGGLGQFDLITFNKVLEHVPEPVVMLARSAEYLNKGAFVYVELPDGEAAVKNGPEREEFFIEHYHVFSAASLALLASRSGFTVLQIERLREPSSKYTLRAFLAPAENVGL